MRQTIKLKKEEIYKSLLWSVHLKLNNEQLETINILIDNEYKKEINNINNLIYNLCLYLYKDISSENVNTLFNIIVGRNTFIEITE